MGAGPHHEEYFHRESKTPSSMLAHLVGHAPKMQAMCWVAMAGKIYYVGRGLGRYDACGSFIFSRWFANVGRKEHKIFNSVVHFFFFFFL